MRKSKRQARRPRPIRAPRRRKGNKVAEMTALLKKESESVVVKPVLLPKSDRKWVRPASWGPIPSGNAGNWIYPYNQTKTIEDIDSPIVITSQKKPNAPLTFLESLLDQFYESNYKSAPPEFYMLFADHQYKQADIKECWEHYNSLLNELNDTSKIAKEYYSHLKPRQKSSYVGFLQKLLDDCETYLTNLRKSSKVRKPRKRKIKTADQLATKVQFKESDPSLKLVSIAPATIHGATACWLYNAKRRRLTYLEAGGTGSLTIKGTTIIRFDPKMSKSKRIRKPEQIVELLAGTKAAMLRAFTKLRVKENAAKGRLNKDTLILKVMK